MKKMINILMDGMSLEMMKLPDIVDLSVLSDAGLGYMYPECLAYKSMWQEFDDISFMDVTKDKLRSVSSADQALMLSTGYSKNYIDLNWNEFDFVGNQLFNKLTNNCIKVGAVTNMPITDSTIGMFLAADEVNTYTPKTNIKKISYTNKTMQENIAKKITETSWDLLIGGGRMFFRPYCKENNLSQVEYGEREDEIDVYKEINKCENIKIYSEYTYDKDLVDCLNNRNLVLLNSKDFHFEAERKRVKSKEPRLSEVCMDAVNILNKTNCDWYLLIESGKVDPAAHNNNAYYVLTEVLEIYRFLYNLSKRDDRNDYAIIFTSDHATGGMSICDSYNLPYDGFKEGIAWGHGPGKKREDIVDYIQDGTLLYYNPFTEEIIGKNEFRSQSVANYNVISVHSRDVVPLLTKNIKVSSCYNHIDLYHNILAFYNLEEEKVKNKFILCNRFDDEQKEYVKAHMMAGKGIVLDKNKYLLNCEITEYVENCVIENIVQDAISLSYYYENIVIYNICRKEDLILLDKLKQYGELEIVEELRILREVRTE